MITFTNVAWCGGKFCEFGSEGGGSGFERWGEGSGGRRDTFKVRWRASFGGVGVWHEVFGFGEETIDERAFESCPRGAVTLTLKDEDEDLSFEVDEHGARVWVRVVAEESERVDVFEYGSCDFLGVWGVAHVVS
jgi:hypothetical protein